MKYKANVVNILGAPGVGKSTFTAKLFAEMKIRGINVEVCTEFIKDKIWEEHKMVLSNQLYIFASQYFKLCCVADKADIVISDGALITEPIYNDYEEPMKSHLNLLVHDVETHFNNHYYFIQHSENEYKDFGRLHSREESREKENMLINFLNENNVSFGIIPNNDLGINTILEDLI